MYIPKRYGQSRTDSCPFCDRQATNLNSQGIPVCVKHRNAKLSDMRCACGELLDIRQGKFGVFFSCMSCGSQSMSKVFSINEVKYVSGTPKQETPSAPKKNFNRRKPKEITIRSDDPRFF